MSAVMEVVHFFIMIDSGARLLIVNRLGGDNFPRSVTLSRSAARRPVSIDSKIFQIDQKIRVIKIELCHR